MRYEAINGFCFRIYLEYNASVEVTEAARIEFEEGIEDETSGSIFRSIIGLTTSLYKMYKGKPPTGLLFLFNTHTLEHAPDFTGKTTMQP